MVRHLPLDRLRVELFSDPVNAAKVRKAYRIAEDTAGPDLERRVFALLAQKQQDPLLAVWISDAIFEQAVLAIGSNSRSWAAFRANIEPLSRELRGFDVGQVRDEASCDAGAFADYVARLRPHLRGLSSTRDAEAILRFAQVLAACPDYYEQLRAAYWVLRDKLGGSGEPVGPIVAACVALMMSNTRYDSVAKSLTGFTYKIHGMGIPLASEFLRNLGWSTYKPDRHVIEMLGRWYEPAEQRAAVGPELEAICDIFGELPSSDARLVIASLLGARATPPGTSINQADQLVWLYRSTLGSKRAH